MDSTTKGTGSLARSIIWATVLSSAVLIGGSTLAVWAAQGRPGEGLAIGLFCAVWGGPGFGAMFGAGFHALRNERIAAVPATIPATIPAAIPATVRAVTPAAATARPTAIPLPPVPESRAWTV